MIESTFSLVTFPPGGIGSNPQKFSSGVVLQAGLIKKRRGHSDAKSRMQVAVNSGVAEDARRLLLPEEAFSFAARGVQR
ncbi:MAG: hypothetical protein AUG51_20040 [Acidobacteria bacterium 13_1_20CM_3_53_8]|nr:MAG: hypothetical protein AUG51_20040 [Acidobacteria bacterium 13_1_20CM_3_53_8]